MLLLLAAQAYAGVHDQQRNYAALGDPAMTT